MPIYLYVPEQFDHTFACYATDYIISLEFLLFYLKFNAQEHTIEQQAPIDALLFSSIACLTASLVHQFFKKETQKILFTMLWHVSVLCTILTTASIFQVVCSLLGIQKRLVYVVAAFIYAISNIHQQSMFETQMIFAALMLLCFIAVNLILRKAGYLEVFGAEVLLIAGVIMQMRKIGFQHFNHNAIFHTLTGVSYYLMFGGLIAMLE